MKYAFTILTLISIKAAAQIDFPNNKTGSSAFPLEYALSEQLLNSSISSTSANTINYLLNSNSAYTSTLRDLALGKGLSSIDKSPSFANGQNSNIETVVFLGNDPYDISTANSLRFVNSYSSSSGYSVNVLDFPSLVSSSTTKYLNDSLSAYFDSYRKVGLVCGISNGLVSFPHSTSGILSSGSSFISFTNDTSKTAFSSFSDIGLANYVNKDNIGSFEFYQYLLSDENGKSFPIRSTYFSGSIISSNSAALGNGGNIIEKGIYQTEWQGFDSRSYATLKAGTFTQPVSFTLDPSANISGNNQEGYFTVTTLNGNRFSLGTISSSHAIIGFDLPHSTLLTLKADTIESSAVYIHDGIFKTTTLSVSDGNLEQTLMSQNTVAYFASGSAEGTEVKVINQNSSPFAYAGVTLAHGSIVNRITSYFGNRTEPYLSGTLAFESNSPEGMVFSLSSEQDGSLGDIRFLFDSEESLAITANSISIAKAIILRGITDDQMFEIENPAQGTIINNKSRQSLAYYKGDQWFEIIMKPIKRQKKKLASKTL